MQVGAHTAFVPTLDLYPHSGTLWNYYLIYPRVHSIQGNNMVHEEGTTHCKGPYRGWYPNYTLLNLSQGDSTVLIFSCYCGISLSSL